MNRSYCSHSDLGHRLLHTREVSFDADEPNSLQARKLLQLQQSLRSYQRVREVERFKISKMSD